MRKILVVNMNYMGDALLTTPALAALRRMYPEAQIDTVVGAGPAAQILEGNPDLNRIIPRTAPGSWARCSQLYKLLREDGGYTDTIILPPLPAYALTAFLARTPVRIGRADRGMNRFLTQLLPANALHMADAMLETIPDSAKQGVPRKRLYAGVNHHDHDAAEKLLTEAGIDLDKPLLAVNVGATRPQKRWFAESFAATLDKLGDIQCVLIGAGAQDEALASDIVKLTKISSPVNLVARTTVKQLAALLTFSDILLSADSGPMHLATAVGTPVVALFGSTDPKMTGPYDNVSRVLYKALPCAPCNNHPTCGGRYDCMRDISPDETAIEIRSLLRERRGGDSAPQPSITSTNTSRTLASAASAKPYQRILIETKFRFIGDTLVAIPIFRAARLLWPNAHIVLLTGKNARALLQNNPYLDEIIEFGPTSTDRGLLPFWSIVRRLYQRHFDLCLILNRSFHSALIPWLSGAKVRAGFDSEGRGALLSFPVEYDREKSEIACYFDVLKSVAPEAAIDSSLELWVNAQERADAKSLVEEALGRQLSDVVLAGIQPGASLEGKRWSAERFAAVAQRIISLNPAVHIALIGGPDEKSAEQEMLSHCSPELMERTVSFVGKCSLRGSLGILSHLNLFVGNDTAVTHSAVALHIPTVALFGPTNPRKWGNYGERNRVIGSTDGQMSSIQTEQVFEAVVDLLTMV